ncbi:MAG: adenosylcobinamide-GDP ribazoletransferase [Geminicoccaceae bacterium]|nr:adenosylcobinamide-GDP ribazoletransferase [Geminicoccaceae bacterium]
MLLTRLPAGRGEVRVMPAASVWAFPLVGLAVGAIAVLCMLAAALFLPVSTALLLAMIAGLLVTGALHEDGLADLADGFGGGRDREAKLAIMRDSRIGSYGVLALVMAMALRFVLLAGLEPAMLVRGWIVAAAVSRAAMVGLLWRMKPARADGLGRSVEAPTAGRVMAAVAIAMAAALLLMGIGGLIMGIFAVFGVSFMRLWANRQIGGYTGDVLGATQVITELAALAAAVAWTGGR